jgi:hypothetical protein
MAGAWNDVDPSNPLNLAAFFEFTAGAASRSRLELLGMAEKYAQLIKDRADDAGAKQFALRYMAEYTNQASLFQAKLSDLREIYRRVRFQRATGQIDAIIDTASATIKSRFVQMSKDERAREIQRMMDEREQAKKRKAEQQTVRQALKKPAYAFLNDNPCAHQLTPRDPATIDRVLGPMKPYLGSLVPNDCQKAALEFFMERVLASDDGAAGGVVFGDDAGLGKTIGALLAAVYFLINNPGRRVIVTLPKAALKAWNDELARAGPLLRSMTVVIDSTTTPQPTLDFACDAARLILITDTTVATVWRHLHKARPFDETVWTKLRPRANDLVICDEADALLPDQKAAPFGLDRTMARATFNTAKTQSMADFVQMTRRVILVTATAFHGNCPEVKVKCLVLLTRPRGMKTADGRDIDTAAELVQHFDEYKQQFFSHCCLRRLKEGVRKHLGLAEPVKHYEPICVQPTTTDELYIGAAERAAANPPPGIMLSSHFLKHMQRLSEQTLHPEMYYQLEHEILTELRAQGPEGHFKDTRTAVRARVVKARLLPLARTMPLSAVAATAVALMGQIVRDCKGSLICFGDNKWHLEYLQFLAQTQVDWGCGCEMSVAVEGEISTYHHVCGCEGRVHVLRQEDTATTRAAKVESYAQSAPSIMIMSEKLGGRALSLPTCNHVIRFVPKLNTAVGIQADARCDRLVSHYGDMASDLYYWLVYTPGIVSFTVKYILGTKLDGTLEVLEGSDVTGDGLRKVVESVAAHVDREGVAKRFGAAVGGLASLRKPNDALDLAKYLRAVPKTPSPPRAASRAEQQQQQQQQQQTSMPPAAIVILSSSDDSDDEIDDEIQFDDDLQAVISDAALLPATVPATQAAAAVAV